METDALQLCHAMKSSDYDLSEVGLLIQELRSLVSNNFSFCSFEFVPRVDHHCSRKQGQNHQFPFVIRLLMLSLIEGGTKSWEL
jgi:hypothetical protein